MQTIVSGFNDLKPELLADVVAIRLAFTCLGTSTSDAAARLRIPQPAVTRAFQVVNRALAVSDRRTAFDQAIHNVAEHLDSATGRIDYGNAATRSPAGASAAWNGALIADMPAYPLALHRVRRNRSRPLRTPTSTPRTQ